MTRTVDEFEAKCRGMFNHIVMLYDFELVRLIGCGEDEDDWYYIVQRPYFNENLGGVVLSDGVNL